MYVTAESSSITNRIYHNRQGAFDNDLAQPAWLIKIQPHGAHAFLCEWAADILLLQLDLSVFNQP